MTNTTPPDWVLLEAAKRFAWNTTVSRLRSHYHNTHFIGYTALCDMILKHEQPPVDRKLLCVEQAKHETGWEKDWMGTSACLRAIELYESGFGK